MTNQRSFHPALLIPVIMFFCTVCDRSGDFIADRDREFNGDWKFMRDSLPGGTELPDYNDSNWTVVDLPHDWSVTGLIGEDGPGHIGPFSISSPGATSTGYAIGDTAWYRKHFTLRAADAGKIAVLRFDGVYMETEVWVNGRKAGSHVYGYTPFWFDITSMLNKPGEDNLIAVKVSNTGRNSRWYSGSGIYRNVFLTLAHPVHIGVWGVKVTTPSVTDAAAMVDLGITVQNEGNEPDEAQVTAEIFGPDGKSTARAESRIPLPAKDQTVFALPVEIRNPVLWSVESPNLYRAEISIHIKGRLTDRYAQSFGIRTIEVSTDGFRLNGKPLELKGGCLHHDNGLLGAAAFERAEERRVEIMKANGFNAIRTSHNPPSEAFLNACDRLGMLVIDETFDVWERPKNPQDYHLYFKAWWKRDVEAMIKRDRNHPSVICWSIGNEVNERADTSGVRIAGEILAFIRQLDDTRFFTNAICEFWDQPGRQWDATAPAFDPLTIGGYNYQWQRYESDHAKYPDRIMMGTESVPMDAFENWQQVIKNSWVIGDFVWTGMDYLGETGIGHTQYLTAGQQDVFAMTWPWFNAWCGDIDITGEKKPQMFYRDVVWGNSLLEINVHAPVPAGKTEKISYWGWPDEYPNWNWLGNEDKLLRVSVYTTGSSVRLELNGRVIGEKEVTETSKLTASFDVPYEPGELKAVAMLNGKEIAVKTLKTTGAPAGIKLTADRSTIMANRNDLAYVTIVVVDEFGQLVTDAARQVSLSVTGNGELIGSGNASPNDMKSFGKPVITTFRGRGMAIIRPFAEPGSILLKAESTGLKTETIEIGVNRTAI